MSDKPRSQSSLFEAAGLEKIFAPLRDHSGCVIAVSGGADSLALLHAAARWREAVCPHVTMHVVTVDHGLRAAAFDEARFAAEVSALLNLPHKILKWRGEKPLAGIQNAARSARYSLMRDYAVANGLGAIVTAHTLEDQAETLMMRLARGSGLDGLAGMAAVSRFGETEIIRPFLNISKSRLKAFLRSIGEGWIEDPSNQDVRFERVRIRRALALLRKQGFDTRALALSARRLGRARESAALAVSALAASALQVFPEGWARLDMAALKAAPLETAIGVMSRILAGFGGGARPARLSKIEALCDMLLKADTGKWTLGGCELRLSGQKLTVMREAGRTSGASLVLSPGEALIWDGRFKVKVVGGEQPVRVCALGASGLRLIGTLTPNAPKAALRTTPAFWLGERMMAAPLASTYGAASPDHENIVCQATFIHPF